MTDLRLLPLLLVVAVTVLGAAFVAWIYGLLITGLVGVPATLVFLAVAGFVLVAVAGVLREHGHRWA